jgi:hypothetical protein
VFNAGDFSPAFTFVGSRDLMAHKLHLGDRVLTFGQPGEMLGTDFTLQTPPLGQPTLPFAMPLLVPAPVILLLGRKLPLMIRAYPPL